MTTVWIALGSDSNWEEQILGVFSTEDAAKAEVAKRKFGNVEPWKLDVSGWLG